MEIKTNNETHEVNTLRSLESIAKQMLVYILAAKNPKMLASQINKRVGKVTGAAISAAVIGDIVNDARNDVPYQVRKEIKRVKKAAKTKTTQTTQKVTTKPPPLPQARTQHFETLQEPTPTVVTKPTTTTYPVVSPSAIVNTIGTAGIIGGSGFLPVIHPPTNTTLLTKAQRPLPKPTKDTWKDHNGIVLWRGDIVCLSSGYEYDVLDVRLSTREDMFGTPIVLLDDNEWYPAKDTEFVERPPRQRR